MYISPTWVYNGVYLSYPGIIGRVNLSHPGIIGRVNLSHPGVYFPGPVILGLSLIIRGFGNILVPFLTFSGIDGFFTSVQPWGQGHLICH